MMRAERPRRGPLSALRTASPRRPPAAALSALRTASPLVRQGRLQTIEHRLRGSQRRRTGLVVDGDGSDAELVWSCDGETPSWSRAYLGYTERFRDDYECLVRRGAHTHILRILQLPVVSAAHRAEASGSSDGGLSTGSTVWDAGIVLARYIATLPRPGERVALIELGAGTGHVGLTAAACCPEVVALVLTDLPTVVPLLEANVARNAGALPATLRAAALAYRWGEAAELLRLRAALVELSTPRSPGAPAAAASALRAAEAVATEAYLSASMEHWCDAALFCVPLSALDSVYCSPGVVLLRVVRP
ncbi:hypothetical protein T492DRAFT_887521 [Pavlovales sp. CCMP2436]|nr:hypothetical protein T492DRAFT_887521 [Pavlovales sp. CCMP2436]